MEQVSDTEYRFNRDDTYCRFYAGMGVAIYLLFALPIAFLTKGGYDLVIKREKFGGTYVFVNSETGFVNISPNVIDWRSLIVIILLHILWYYLFIREYRLTFKKKMIITDTFIKSGRQKFDRTKVAFISITPGITSRYGRAQTYRVNLKMKGWLFTNK